MAIEQFKNSSSWRKYDISINPHEVYHLNFNDTNPNIFVVNNPNLATLKLGVTSIPREENYEFRVEYNTTETLGRPIGTRVLYILNDSVIPVKLHIFSIEKEFDPVILKNMNVSLEGQVLESFTTLNGVKAGVTLPVTIDNNYRILLEEILESNNGNIDELKNVIKAIKENQAVINTENMIVNSVWTSDLINAVIGRIEDIRKILVKEAIKTRHDLQFKSIEEESYIYTATSNNELFHFERINNDGGILRIRQNNKIICVLDNGESIDKIDVVLDAGEKIIFDSPTDNNESLRVRLMYYIEVL